MLRILSTVNIKFNYSKISSHHMPVRLKDSPKVQRTRLQYATWLGSTSALIVVIDNDIYLRQSPSDEEDIRITNTGQLDLIYNGIPDWLYQGELINFSFASLNLIRLVSFNLFEIH